MPQLIFRKGLNLKHEVAGVLADSYHSDLIDAVKEADFQYSAGRITIHLAREFGFCYGVDRAVDYAYQTRRRFPDRAVYLTGEIIHNPHVNDELRAQGIRFLSDPGESLGTLTPDDVVILPAFGVTIEMLVDLQGRGCTLVDTTCGSVLNVWKNVKRYAEEGFTSIVHGKYRHEETRATVSQALQTTDGRSGHYIVVLDRDEASVVCDFIRSGGDREQFLARFEHATSPGFEPGRDLQRVGCANQTTMLSSESLEIGEMFRSAMRDRHGEAALSHHFRAFDTICSATQDRQDAVLALLAEQSLDLMVVIGGLNSSNTCNLARICVDRVPTYHIADPDGLLSAKTIRHKAVGRPGEVTSQDWLPPGDLRIGLTSGASTPDNLVGATIQRLSVLANGA
ncbi:MAG: 4-hydroxy-3-methylbut-2-enyl diphosphate reductase [Acidobacteria bacterium]|nr:4-hydroxy-3-methylbut-2-enyl diphosphate reductase [Acidobacteriota bacterium]